MPKQLHAKLSDFGWAVTWDGEADKDFNARQARRFAAMLPIHNSADEALSYWKKRYGPPVRVHD